MLMYNDMHVEKIQRDWTFGPVVTKAQHTKLQYLSRSGQSDVEYVMNLVDRVFGKMRGPHPDYGFGLMPMYPKNDNENFSQFTLMMMVKKWRSTKIYGNRPVVVANIPKKFETNFLVRFFQHHNFFHDTDYLSDLQSFSVVSAIRSDCIYIGSPTIIPIGSTSSRDRFNKSFDLFASRAASSYITLDFFTLLYEDIEECCRHVKNNYPGTLYFLPYALHRLDIIVSTFNFPNEGFLEFNEINLFSHLYPNSAFSALRIIRSMEGKLFNPKSFDGIDIEASLLNQCMRLLETVGYQEQSIFPIRGALFDREFEFYQIKSLDSTFRWMVSHGNNRESIVPMDHYDEDAFHIPYYGMIKHDKSVKHHSSTLVSLGLFKELKIEGTSRIVFLLTPSGLAVYQGRQAIPTSPEEVLPFSPSVRSLSFDECKTDFYDSHIQDHSCESCLCKRCTTCKVWVNLVSSNQSFDHLDLSFLPHEIFDLYEASFGILSHVELALALKNRLEQISFSFIGNFSVPSAAVILSKSPNEIDRTMRSDILPYAFRINLLNSILFYDRFRSTYRKRR